MAGLDALQGRWPDRVLLEPTRPVERFDDELRELRQHVLLPQVESPSPTATVEGGFGLEPHETGPGVEVPGRHGDVSASGADPGYPLAGHAIADGHLSQLQEVRVVQEGSGRRFALKELLESRASDAEERRALEADLRDHSFSIRHKGDECDEYRTTYR